MKKIVLVLSVLLVSVFLISCAKETTKTMEEIAKVDFDGEVAIEAEIDAKTMIDCSIKVTSSNVFGGLFKDIPASEEVVLNNQSLTVTASISTKDAVPTLSQDEKDAATKIDLNFDLNAIMSLLGD